MGLLDSDRVPRDRTYSGTHREFANFRIRDCHPLWFRFPSDSSSWQICNSTVMSPTTPRCRSSAVWANSFSLAATGEIVFTFCSYGYLDVSVHRVCLIHLWIQCMIIRESRDQRSFDSFPELFAAFHALHRLLAPRHPPYALEYLTTMTSDSQPLCPKAEQQLVEIR
jgi:hypothetical protein